ncbi:MAG: DNA-binding response regulator [Actinobacteria bacterium]|uniref:DNA-binding response regulator n=1 Tax=Candidatus Fonsibacter lacus TaxID=2576439 RepID=A0A965GEF8_9PROT|nr:DNA-binding response regulator [Candidatus Fonsibacter lacus]
MTENNPLKILIVEDHPIVRQGLIRALNAHGFQNFHEAGSCDEGRGQLAKVDPDILITDLHLPDGLSFDLVRWARKIKPEMAIVILTVESEGNFLIAASQSGANALVNKSAPITQLIAAIKLSLNSPKSFLAEGLGEALRQEHAKPKLTPRELEILQHLTSGEELQIISAKLFISLPTIKTHLSSIYRKLECENRTSAVTRAINLGLVQIKN